MSEKTQYTHVRIRQSTRDRLQARLALTAADGIGAWAPCLRHDGSYVSIDAIINILLDRDDDHRARAKASRRRRGKGQVPCADASATGCD